MRSLIATINNFLTRVNPSKLNAADDQQYIAACGALERMGERVEKLEAVVELVEDGNTGRALDLALAALDGGGDG